MKSSCLTLHLPLRAVLVAGSLTASASAALEVAGPLLIDLDATDYNTTGGIWPQHSDTGIPGGFSKQPTGTPQLQTIAGKLALVLDGDGDYFTGPVTTAALDGANAPHSVEYWVFQGQARPEESVISWSGRGGPDGTYAGFRYGSSGSAGAVGRWGGAGDMGFAAPFIGGPTMGVWHHIAVTYDGTTQCVYVDGQLNASEAANLDSKDGLPIYIGGEHNTDGTDSGRVRQFSGAISKVRVHGGALTAEQVLNNYNTEAADYPGLTTAALSHPPLHRWSFSEAAGNAAEGTVVADSIGGLTGVVKGTGAVFTGTGVTLPGGLPATLPAYIDLPNGLVSSKKHLTLELWATQTSTQSGSRVMSFSESTLGEINTAGNTPGFNGVESISLYANTRTDLNMKLERNGGTFPNGGGFRQSEGATTFNTQVHYVITYDTDFKEWRLYRNGALMETLPETQGPTSIGDVNNWLGRSDFGADSGFAGTIDEFRVYNYTLSESEIYGNTLAGPDTLTSGDANVFRWTPTAGGTYAFNNSGGQDNWNPVGTFPDAAGATATMVSNLAGNQTVNLNTTATIGNLTIGDVDGSHSLNISPGNGGVLEMSAGSGVDASLTQSSTSGPNEISAPLLLSSNTELANTSGTAALTISGALSGAGNFSKAGTGQVVLTADNSAYAGTISVNSGQLVIGNGGVTGTLGSGPVVLTDEGILTLNRQDATTFNKSVSGAGIIRLTGNGKVTNTSNLNTTGALQVYPSASLTTQVPITVGSTSIDGDLVLDKPLAMTTGDFIVGDLQPGFSHAMVSDGTLNAATILVGKNAGTSGVILQTGGTVNDVTGGTDCYIGGGNNAAFGVWGVYRMTGGVLNTSNHFQIGAQGIGIMEVENATVNFNAGVPSIGRFQNGTNSRGRGLLDIRAGGVINQNAAGSRMTIGEKGTGNLNVRNGGTAVLTGGLLVSAGGANDSGDGTVNLLTGGTIETQIVVKGGGIREALFNFNGGTLRARADQPGTNQSMFMSGMRAYVYGGGAVIDSNGFNIRTNQIFENPTGNGVATIPVLSGGSGYLAPPYVEIVGDGKGATAIANLAEGRVTSITITNPGTDYTSPPTVNILGGGQGTGLSLGIATLAPNEAGTVEKTGLGSLSLEGEMTYTGSTNVKQGTLLVNGDQFNATGSTHISAGASLGGVGLIGGDVLAAGSINPGRQTTGDTVGRLTANSGVAFEAGGSLVIDIDDNSEQVCDTLTVGNHLNLTGAALIVNLSGPAIQLPYTIATFASRTGEFASVPEGITVAYHSNSIEITSIDVPTGNTFGNWIAGFFPGETDPLIVGAGADPDGDGSINLQEYALGGLPNDGSKNPQLFLVQTDKVPTGTGKDTVMTIAVLEGTPAFVGDPSPTASIRGLEYSVQGSPDLHDFEYPVSAIDPVTTNLGDPPAGYEFRSFKLENPTGDLRRGFMRVKVTGSP